MDENSEIETRLVDRVSVDKGNKVIVIRLSERLYTIEPLEVIEQTPKRMKSNLVHQVWQPSADDKVGDLFDMPRRFKPRNHGKEIEKPSTSFRIN